MLLSFLVKIKYPYDEGIPKFKIVFSIKPSPAIEYSTFP